MLLHFVPTMPVSFPKEVSLINSGVSKFAEKLKVLRNLDCFVLDNSIRESAVGHRHGHTLEDKWKIYNEVKKCGIKHIVVAATCHTTRVDEEFIRQLGERGEDFSTLYAFTEVAESFKDGVPDTDTVPMGLRKMQAFGLRNPIIEIDLADKTVDWERKTTVDDYYRLILRRIEWAKENLSRNSKIFVNIRDLPIAIQSTPQRLLKMVHYLATLPEQFRLFGLQYEEPTGRFMPEEMGIYTSTVRKIMDKAGWADGKLLVNVHEKWGLAQTTALECLSKGANGVWCSLSQEGTALGHACSTVTLMNLVRMGNTIVQESYNCTNLRKAAIVVTNVVGVQPHPKQIIYGPQALDITFDFEREDDGGDFDLAGFFGEKSPLRMHTLSSTEMIRDRLIDLFGKDPQFTSERGEEMLKMMLQDLRSNRREEYMSKVGLAVLFERSGGKITKEMKDSIDEMELKSATAKRLISDIRAIWEKWDPKDGNEDDSFLEVNSFFYGFMSPYFRDLQCEDTKKALQAVDMDSDGCVEWSKFMVYLKWALHEYPEIRDAKELLSVTFQKGLIAFMQDADSNN